MFNKTEIYRLNTDRFSSEFDDSAKALPKRRYRVYLIPGGPDAAIQVTGDAIACFIDNAPARIEKFIEFANDYDVAILQATRELRRDESDTIVFTGRWVDLDFDQEPYLDTFLIHVVHADGSVDTRFYDLEIFDPDILGKGPTLAVDLSAAPGKEAVAALSIIAEQHVDLDKHPRSPKGPALVDGMIWLPLGEAENHLPIVISHCVGWKMLERQERQRNRTPTDGEMLARTEFQDGLRSLKSELLVVGSGDKITEALQSSFCCARSKLVAITDPDDLDDATRQFQDVLKSTAFAEFREQLVHRSHRPATMTLREILASTDATGYWLQFKSPDAEEPEEPRYSVATQYYRGRWIDTYLHQQSSGSHDLRGNEYASGWQSVGNCTARILAVGPSPG